MANEELLAKKKRLLELKKEALRRQSVVHEAQQMGISDAAATFARQGLTFGLADEIEAGIDALRGFAGTEGTLGERLEAGKVGAQTSMLENRLRREELRKQFPKTAFFGEAAGGTLTGIGAGLGLANQLRALPTALRPVTAGAMEGGLFGFGTSDGDLSNRLRGAAQGTILGGAATPVFQGLSVATMNLLRPAARRIGEGLFGRPRDRAVREVMRALDADELTVPEAMAMLRELGPRAVLADLGDAVGRQGRAVTSRLGPSASQTRRFLDERQLQNQMALRQTARRATGVDNFDRGIIEVINGAESQARKIYNEVFSEVVDVTPAMLDFFKRPAIKRARAQAAKLLRDEGFSDEIINDVTDVRYMDAVKRALQDMEGRSLRTGQNNQARILGNLRREFVQEIDKQVPRYAEARSIFAGEAAMRDAADLGRTVFASNRIGTNDAIAAIREMGDSELRAARVGFLEWLEEALEGQAANQNTIANKFANVPKFQRLITSLFEDQRAVADFLNEASAQARFAQTRNLVTGGSPTARIQQDVAGLSPGLISTVIDSGVSPGSAIANILRLIRGNTQLSDEVIEEMQRILFDPNIVPAQLRQNPFVRPFNIPRVPSPVAAGGFGGFVGSQVPPLGDTIGLLTGVPTEGSLLEPPR